MILDCSYNYHANNVYRQVAPTEMYVKKHTNKRANRKVLISHSTNNYIFFHSRKRKEAYNFKRV